jgi:hypothetical protein
MPAALPELAAEAAPLLLLLLVLELARGVCCGEHSLTTGNLRTHNTSNISLLLKILHIDTIYD